MTKKSATIKTFPTLQTKTLIRDRRFLISYGETFLFSSMSLILSAPEPGTLGSTLHHVDSKNPNDLLDYICKLGDFLGVVVAEMDKQTERKITHQERSNGGQVEIIETSGTKEIGYLIGNNVWLATLGGQCSFALCNNVGLYPGYFIRETELKVEKKDVKNYLWSLGEFLRISFEEILRVKDKTETRHEPITGWEQVQIEIDSRKQTL